MGDLLLWGSALFQVARHIKFNSDSEADNGEAAGENQNLYETEGSDANKIEAWVQVVLGFMPAVSLASLTDF